MKMRDEIGILYQDGEFTDLFAKDGQPALAPWQLALVTIMQFVEWNCPEFGGKEKRNMLE